MRLFAGAFLALHTSVVATTVVGKRGLNIEFMAVNIGVQLGEAYPKPP